MRPLPRLLAFTDGRIAQLPDLGVRASALAAVGSAVALVARIPGGTADALATLAARLRTLVAPPMAQFFVTGRTDVAMATNANGMIVRRDDLRADDIRGMRECGMRECAIFASVHSLDEAKQAIDEGADALIAGNIWETSTHPDRPASQLEFLREIVSLRVPVYAIGGVTPARALEAYTTGAWGVASISAAWDSPDPYQAALELTKPWRET